MNMHKCDNCQSDIDRTIFCSAKCRVAFHRLKAVPDAVTATPKKIVSEATVATVATVAPVVQPTLTVVTIPEVIPENSAVGFATEEGRKVFDTTPCTKHKGFKGTCGCE